MTTQNRQKSNAKKKEKKEKKLCALIPYILSTVKVHINVKGKLVIFVNKMKQSSTSDLKCLKIVFCKLENEICVCYFPNWLLIGLFTSF